VLDLVEVGKVFPGPNPGAVLRVLDGVSMRIDRGETLAVTGPSGSGKSTLLNLMGGLDRPTSGRVLFGGVSLNDLEDPQLSRYRNRDVGLVFQQHHLLPQLTALENCLVPTLPRAALRSRAGAAEKARGLLERVGLGKRLDHRPAQLSGGECQRVAVARALVNEPSLLLADEPTGSLDGVRAADLVELLLELNREHGVALVLATHSSEVAAVLARSVRLRDGRVEPV